MPFATFAILVSLVGQTAKVDERLEFMKTEAAAYRLEHATDYFKDKSWSDLRLLPTPVARYGKAGAAVIDGALFAFAIGTDPEVCVFLEARQGKEGPEWFYAMGPMTCFSVKVTYKKTEVWDLPRRRPDGNPKVPYYITVEKL
jgi:hypothetical protein